MSDHEDKQRRSADRFPMDRDIRYRVLERKGSEPFQLGKTINMSSHGVLFTTDQSLNPGRYLEISISWPAQLNSQVALKFVARRYKSINMNSARRALRGWRWLSNLRGNRRCQAPTTRSPAVPDSEWRSRKHSLLRVVTFACAHFEIFRSCHHHRNASPGVVMRRRRLELQQISMHQIRRHVLEHAANLLRFPDHEGHSSGLLRDAR